MAKKESVPAHSNTDQMITSRVIVILFSAIVLFGCQSLTNTIDKQTEAPPSLDVLLSEAAAEAKKEAIDVEKVRGILLQAKKLYPTSAEPWLFEAQMRFEAANYGEAIVAAQEAIQRDPADRQGHRIMVGAGLRIATASLATLRKEDSVSGALRSDTVQLYKSLQDSLGLGTAPVVPAGAKPPPPVPSVKPFRPVIKVTPPGKPTKGLVRPPPARSTDQFGVLIK